MWVVLWGLKMDFQKVYCWATKRVIMLVVKLANKLAGLWVGLKEIKLNQALLISLSILSRLNPQTQPQAIHCSASFQSCDLQHH